MITSQPAVCKSIWYSVIAGEGGHTTESLRRRIRCRALVALGVHCASRSSRAGCRGTGEQETTGGNAAYGGA